MGAGKVDQWYPEAEGTFIQQVAAIKMQLSPPPPAQCRLHLVNKSKLCLGTALLLQQAAGLCT